MSDATVPDATVISLETRIVAVTVYTDQALITRRGNVTLTGQEQALTLTHLPLTLKPESVRAGGVGNVAVQLRDVQAERVFATEPVVDRIAQLTAQLEQLTNEQQAIDDSIAADTIQRKFIESLSEKAVDRFSRSLAQQQVSLAETRNLLNFVGQRYSDLSAAIAQHKREQTQLQKQMQALRQQLQQVQTPRPKESYSLTVGIVPAGAGNFELEVSYVCDRASWKPLYDLRVNSTDNRVHLTYLADVTQTTGEDWSAVALTLSTAKPGLGTLPPKLTPWYVDIFHPLPYTPAPMMARKRSASAVPEDDDDDNDSILLAGSDAFESTQPMVMAEAPAAQITNEGGVVTFAIDGNNHIPGDGAFHKITIFNDDYPSHLEYLSIPKLVSFAYLQAVITNPTDGATLLPGQANIFRDNRFVGTTPLENVAPGQEFKLNLGIDEGLKLTRDLVERKVDKQLIGGQRRITYAYRLSVTNLRDREATLNLTEQLPVSRNEKIKVRLNRTSPQILPSDMGLLEWSLYLKPKEQQDISYQFTVEHAPTLNVTGLDI
ncbi:MAG: mucoidy inhibitor MuiA family protein [Tildeniella nuda ZEHNDER 1965/U140]|nr:mucoidy inhibitor MuiA family protein [Tildeniella nuda ZEHNDER 1965/U140]